MLQSWQTAKHALQKVKWCATKLYVFPSLYYISYIWRKYARTLNYYKNDMFDSLIMTVAKPFTFDDNTKLLLTMHTVWVLAIAVPKMTKKFFLIAIIGRFIDRWEAICSVIWNLSDLYRTYCLTWRITLEGLLNKNQQVSQRSLAWMQLSGCNREKSFSNKTYLK